MFKERVTYEEKLSIFYYFNHKFNANDTVGNK